MSDDYANRPPGSSGIEEPRVDSRRYLSALRRSWSLILAIVAVITFVVLIVSLFLPNQYSATATIAFNPETGLFGPPDATSTQRELSTISTLITSSQTEQEAVRHLSGETPSSVHSAISTSVDPNANLIHISATDSHPAKAARLANAVANAFLAVQQKFQEARLLGAKAGLEEQITRLQGTPNATEQIEAIRGRLSHLGVQAASAGTDLQLAEAASPPSSPSSPKPLLNAVLAFFAAIFIGVLVALGRDQLRPGLSSPREVSRLLRVPVLAGIPYVGRKVGRNRAVAPAVEHEAYQNLSASIQTMLPPSGDQKVLLVTSAVHAEGKSTVTSRLGRALAQAGHKTLLISGDIRWPELEALFNVPRAPGLTDVIELAGKSEIDHHLLEAAAHAVSLPAVNGRESADLHLLTSGTLADDPSALLSSSVTEAFFRYLRTCDYRYVLVDGPPSLGIADVQPLTKLTDHVLVVTRLDRVNVENLVDIQEMLARLEAEPFGAVVIGTRVNVSPYYLSERRAPISPPPVTDEPPRPLTAGDFSGSEQG